MNIRPNRWNATGTTVVGVVGFCQNGSSYLKGPTDVFIDDNFSIYIADQQNNRIQKYDQNNRSITTVAGSSNAVAGNQSHELNQPFAITMNSTGALYIADTENHRVMMWLAGATSGILVAGSGKIDEARVFEIFM